MADRKTREQNTRNNSKARWSPPSLLPQSEPREGFRDRYIRTELNGKDDARNVASKLQQGWEFKTLDNDPELQAKFGRSSGNAEIGGLVLAEAPAEMVEQRNAYYSKVTEDQSAAVGVNFEKQNDPRMPVFSERKSTTTRGRG